MCDHLKIVIIRYAKTPRIFKELESILSLIKCKYKYFSQSFISFQEMLPKNQ